MCQVRVKHIVCMLAAMQVADGEHSLKLAGVEASSAAAELLTTRQVGAG